MISIEKALLINLSSGLSLGSAWRGLKTEPIPAEKIPNTLVLNGHHVAELRQLWERRAEPVIAALEALSAQADRLLDQGPWSVVDKTNLPNGQDPHDYRSLAKYWWPDPAKPDGIPYFRRDGDVNPACYSSDYDLLRLESLSDSTVALALSAFITGNVAHRARAIELLRVWFIDPLTRQNPSFAQAQHIPGDTSIRSAGLIESRRLIYIVEAIRLLSATGELPETITQGLHAWFTDFLGWLLSSKPGIHAAAADNNIALWYDLQCAVYARFVGNDSLAQRILVEQSLPRFDQQVSSDGALEHELSREKPYEYLAFTLTALAGLAAVGERLGIPLWSAETSEGRTFEAACDWLRSLPITRELHHGLTSNPDLAAPPADLSELTLHLALLSRVAEARRQRVATLARMQADHEHTLRRLHSTVSKLEAKLQHEKTLIREIKSSPSYLLTRPLRFLDRLISPRSAAVPPPNDSYVLYRIIGNDLHPRHKKGQSIKNLQFILRHEPPLPGCSKLWVVNRIIDKEMESAIIQILKEHDQEWLHIPFNAEDYARIPWDRSRLPHPEFIDSPEFNRLPKSDQSLYQRSLYRLKNLYVMNNNGARNAALKHGRSRAKWILPWDGNCIITLSAWQLITSQLEAHPSARYSVVPMDRLSSNKAILSANYKPNPVEEPQIIFHHEATEEFNENYPYGRRPKVELLWRLGVPGPWDSFSIHPSDPERRPRLVNIGPVPTVGWVARLFSGNLAAEQSNQKGGSQRSKNRQEAISGTIDRLDETIRQIDSSVHFDGDVYIQRNDQLGSRIEGILNGWRLARNLRRRSIVFWPDRTNPGTPYKAADLFDLESLASNSDTKDLSFIDGDYQKTPAALTALELSSQAGWPMALRRNTTAICRSRPISIVKSGANLVGFEYETQGEIKRQLKQLFNALPPHPLIRASCEEARSWLGTSTYTAIHIRRGDILDSLHRIMRTLIELGFSEATCTDRKLADQLRRLDSWIRHFTRRVAPLKAYVEAAKNQQGTVIIFSDTPAAAENVRDQIPGSRVMSEFKTALNPTQRAFFELRIIADAQLILSTQSNFSKLGRKYGNADFVDVRSIQGAKGCRQTFTELFGVHLESNSGLKKYCMDSLNKALDQDKSLNLAST